MSEDNEFSNGANGRFDNLDLRYKAGGRPRAFSEEKTQELVAAMTTIGEFLKGTGLNPAILDTTGALAINMPTLDLLREFKAAKDFKEAVDVIAKEADRIYDYMRLAAVPNRFDEEGIQNMKVEGVGRVQLGSDLYAGIIRGAEVRAFEWMDDNGRGDLVKKQVNSSSLKAFLKKMIEDGEEIPADLFKADPFTRASIVKVK